MIFYQKEDQFMSKEIHMFLLKEVITESEHENGEFASPISLFQKQQSQIEWYHFVKSLPLPKNANRS